MYTHIMSPFEFIDQLITGGHHPVFLRLIDNSTLLESFSLRFGHCKLWGPCYLLLSLTGKIPIRAEIDRENIKLKG